MSIQSKIQKILNDEWTGSIARELDALHERHGRPEPADGPSTELKCGNPALANESDIGEWNGDETEAVRLYNLGITELYECVDVRHIGSGIFYTQYNAGDGDWVAYAEEATEAIEHWINYSAWEEFCNDPYAIGSES